MYNVQFLLLGINTNLRLRLSIAVCCLSFVSVQSVVSCSGSNRNEHALTTILTTFIDNYFDYIINYCDWIYGFIDTLLLILQSLIPRLLTVIDSLGSEMYKKTYSFILWEYFICFYGP